MIPGGGKPLRLLYLTQAEEFGYFLERGGSRALVESNNLIEKKSGNWGFWAGLPSESTPLCRPITTCQREAKAIPLISGADRAEISVRIAPTAVELVLLRGRFGECRNLFFGLPLLLRNGHPFANDFSARKELDRRTLRIADRPH